MRKIEHELKRKFPFVQIEITNGGHMRLRLPNGEAVFVGATPSDRRNMYNIRSEIRRRMKTKIDREEH